MVLPDEAVPSHHPKRVQISELSEMIIVTNLARTPEKPDIWFHQCELDHFKSNFRCDGYLVRSRISCGLAPSTGDILGLEKFLTPRLTEKYKAERRRVFRRVLAEAQRQRREEDEDPHRLAQVSEESTKWARARARAAALFLAQDQEAERLLELGRANDVARAFQRESRGQVRRMSPTGVDDIDMIDVSVALGDRLRNEKTRD